MSDRIIDKIDALGKRFEEERQVSREYRADTKGRLEEILEQAKTTNGRVMELERWQSGHSEYSESQRDKVSKLEHDCEDLEDRLAQMSRWIWVATGSVGVIVWLIGHFFHLKG